MTNGPNDPSAPRRTLAGATILQIVPSLRDEPMARSAVNVAHVLLQAGARALIAAESGPLVNEITQAGAEWIPMVTDTVNPLRLRRNAQVISRLIEAERIDIVHAYEAAAAFSARLAAARIAVWLVTSAPDSPTAFSGLRGRLAAALAEGDRIIAPSNFAAQPLMQRYKTSAEQITIVPHAIDTATFDPARIPAERADALRAAWRAAPEDQVILVPGRVAPWNGQALLPEIARALLDDHCRGFIFVAAGETESHEKYARELTEKAESLGVGAFVRLAGHCGDLPAAFSASDFVAMPAIEAPLLGRAVAQAQAMSRPVLTSDVGMLPENIIAPPRMPEEVRTGWVTRAGDAPAMAAAIKIALALDATSYNAMAARAREFADYMFSPESVAEAMRAVYTSLLAREL